MSESPTDIFTICAAQFPDLTNASQIGSLMQCVSDGQAELTAATADDIATGINVFYLIFAGALVYFMQIGFAMLCAGSIRAKNVKNVILWNLLDSCGGGVAFWAVGYAFAYGGDNDSPEKTFIGSSSFFPTTNSDVAFHEWFFQFTFACALSSIVAGTIAERTQMKAYLMYSVFLAGFVYPVVAHNMWSTNGFLSKFSSDPLWGSGAIDLAGSGAVHMTGGVAALVGAIILGPRSGRFYDRDGNLLDEPAEFPPHNVALQFLGTFCLWFGWYGFNPGSVIKIASAEAGEVAALVATNTTLGACTGAISAMFFSSFLDWRREGLFTYDVTMTMNGCLTGLVAITAGCATVDTWAAVAIGIVAGIVYVLASRLMLRLRIDDAVDAVPVHMFGGAWGLISTGLLSSPDLIEKAYGPSNHAGWFYEWNRDSGNFTLIGIQLIAVLFIFAWSFALMGVWFYAMNLMGWYRVDLLEEEAGMDLSRHKGSAYDYGEESTAEQREKLDARRGSERFMFADSSVKKGSDNGKKVDEKGASKEEEEVENKEANAGDEA